jgi:hypothetical protein
MTRTAPVTTVGGRRLRVRAATDLGKARAGAAAALTKPRPGLGALQAQRNQALACCHALTHSLDLFLIANL